jgi:hypothetical protein
MNTCCVKSARVGGMAHRHTHTDTDTHTHTHTHLCVLDELPVEHVQPVQAHRLHLRFQPRAVLIQQGREGGADLGIILRLWLCVSVCVCVVIQCQEQQQAQQQEHRSSMYYGVPHK